MRILRNSLLLLVTLITMTQAFAFSPYPPPAWYVPAMPYPAYTRQASPAPSLAYARPYPYGYAAPRSASPAAVIAVPQKSLPPSVTASQVPVTGSESEAKSSRTGTKEANQAFLDRLTPIIENENRRLRNLQRSVRNQIEQYARDRNSESRDSSQLKALAQRYRVDGDVLSDASVQEELLQRIDEIPVSLALAQAANESAWGRSRFAREGKNLFGIWTYDENKGIVPRNRAPGKKHLVRVFDSEADSVRYYMFTLNSHPAYTELRRIRAQLRARGESLDGISLAEGLLAYSAKGEEYVRIIRSMIQRFELAVYDNRAPGNA